MSGGYLPSGKPSFSTDHSPSKDGGPATGKSLRDWFAGMAMSAVNAPGIAQINWANGITPDANKIALDAYRIADAMLKARDQ